MATVDISKTAKGKALNILNQIIPVYVKEKYVESVIGALMTKLGPLFKTTRGKRGDRADTAYQLWAHVNRKKISETVTDEDAIAYSEKKGTKRTVPQARQDLTMHLMGQKWRALSVEERQPFVDDAEESKKALKSRLKKEGKLYKPSPPKLATPSPKQLSDWTAFQNMFKPVWLKKKEQVEKHNSKLINLCEDCTIASTKRKKGYSTCSTCGYIMCAHSGYMSYKYRQISAAEKREIKKYITKYKEENSGFKYTIEDIEAINAYNKDAEEYNKRKPPMDKPCKIISIKAQYYPDDYTDDNENKTCVSPISSPRSPLPSTRLDVKMMMDEKKKANIPPLNLSKNLIHSMITRSKTKEAKKENIFTSKDKYTGYVVDGIDSSFDAPGITISDFLEIEGLTKENISEIEEREDGNGKYIEIHREIDSDIDDLLDE